MFYRHPWKNSTDNVEESSMISLDQVCDEIFHDKGTIPCPHAPIHTANDISIKHLKYG